MVYMLASRWGRALPRTGMRPRVLEILEVTRAAPARPPRGGLELSAAPRSVGKWRAVNDFLRGCSLFFLRGLSQHPRFKNNARLV